MRMIVSKIIDVIWHGFHLTSNAQQSFNYKLLRRIKKTLLKKLCTRTQVPMLQSTCHEYTIVTIQSVGLSVMIYLSRNVSNLQKTATVKLLTNEI